MVDNSGLIAGGGVPTGDQLRTATAVLAHNTDTTLLSESAGTGGLVYGFWFEKDSGAQPSRIQNIKVTIDGAAERTLTFDRPSFVYSSTGAIQNYWIPLPIDYKSSVTIKVNQFGNNSTTAEATIAYSLKN